MRKRTLGILAAVTVLQITIPLAAQETKPPVRAKEPTVVTVEGRREEVRPDTTRGESGESRSALSKGLRAAGRGTAWVGRRIAGWMDFNFDNGQVIPSEREQREKQEKKSRR